MVALDRAGAPSFQGFSDVAGGVGEGWNTR